MGMQNSKYLVAGYPFEGNANDIKGVNNMSITGGVYVDGKIGKCLRLDGTDDFGTFQNAIPFSAGTSISFWWNNPMEVNENSAIFGDGSYPNLCILYNNSTKIFYIISGIGGSLSYTIPLTWCHVCIIRRNSSDYDLYVNTAFIGTITTGTILINIKWIGRRTDGRYIQSDFDLLKFHNKALTQQEIQRDYLNLPIF